MDAPCKCCRLCANETPQHDTIHMFSAAGIRYQLSDKIRLCLPISVDEDDKLPKEICIPCLAKLDVCSKFYNDSFSAQNILKSKFDCHSVEQKIQITEVKIVNNPSKNFSTTVPHSISTSSVYTDSLISEKRSSPIISNDVRLNSSTESPTPIKTSTTINYFSQEKLIEEDEIYETNGIVVTDITGKPLEPLPQANNNFSSQLSRSDLTTETIVIDSLEDRLGSTNVNTNAGSNVRSDYNSSSKSKKRLHTKLLSQTKNKDGTPMHNPKQKLKVKCKICHQSVLRETIETHLRLHIKDKLYSCVDCGKDFATEKGLSFHNCEKN